MSGSELERLIKLLSKLPGLGPRSGRRAALQLLKKKADLMEPLRQSLGEVLETVKTCATCGNYDSLDPCQLCADLRRDVTLLCVVEDVSDLWALERTGIYRGHYHVLGGSLSALDGVGPDDLRIAPLIQRCENGGVCEVILALNATVDGQTTCHYLIDMLSGLNLKITRLAHGVPVGGELDYIDDGTLIAALNARRAM